MLVFEGRRGRQDMGMWDGLGKGQAQTPPIGETKCGGYALGVENVYELCTTCHNLRVANIMINK